MNYPAASSGVSIRNLVFIAASGGEFNPKGLNKGGAKMIGKGLRLERIINRHTGKTVIVPMDHGVSSGPITGITNMEETMSRVANGGADAVIVHKGIVAHGYGKVRSEMGLIVHLSGSTSLSPEPNAKSLVCTVEEAIKLGADAVSVHINIGNDREMQMLADLGTVAHTAGEWGIPLLAMIYPRGERIRDEFDPKAVTHAARLGAELGADVVKVSYTGDPESFSKVVEGCHAPVVIAGGPKADTDRAVLEMVKGAIEAGAAGTSIGRNVFQHRDPAAMVAALAMIVHNGADVEEALQFLNSSKEKKDDTGAGRGRELAAA